MRLFKLLRRHFIKIWHLLYNLWGEVNPAPLLIYGNQKSGTSAIAALLAEATGKSLTLDLKRNRKLIQTFDEMLAGKVTVEKFINMHKYEFSREIIKEPGLTMLFQELQAHYNHKPAVFIIRDPRDNIRSILNRLKIPGDLSQNPDPGLIPPAWQKVIDHYGQTPVEMIHYIEKMAWRWNDFAGMARACDDHIIVLKYEDFLKDKKKHIEDLAINCGYMIVKDISSQVDRQFQPGGDSSAKWLDFFGPENLKKIETICNENMKFFEYDKMLK